jgi:SAM-dependent methyltransferase
MSSAEIYDQIGKDYASRRRPDPRWVARIHRRLEGHHTLVNVGAGAGSYEPSFMSVVGVEPSQIMLEQRSPSAAPAVRGIAEQLPFEDDAFDVALAVLSVHHWGDPAAGLAEMQRVSRAQVVVTWDPDVFARQFWLVRDYLPEAAGRDAQLPTLATVLENLASTTTEPLPVPADCTDGFFGAYWRRPHAYLDPIVRGAISGLALLDGSVVAAAMKRLESDLASGEWLARYSELKALEDVDLGYRLVVAGDEKLFSSARADPMRGGTIGPRPRAGRSVDWREASQRVSKPPGPEADR